MERWIANKAVLHIRYLAFLLLIILSGCHQVTIIVKKIPPNTPPGSAIFISGNFNFWDPGDRNYALTLNPKDSTYSVVLPKGSGAIDYRFTRGDWTTVEADLCGNLIENHHLRYQKSDTIQLEIPSWKDLGPTHCDEVTFILNKIPKQTPPDAKLYVGGSFNNWQAADPQFQLKRNNKGQYYIRLHKLLTGIEYKFTRGNWEADEVDEVGNPISNHSFVFGKQDTVIVDIPGWKDQLSSVQNGEWITLLLTVPKTTPDGDRIFVAANFNNWNPHDMRYEMRWIRNWTYTINLPRKRSHIEYKFTRGDWSTVETDNYGNPLENRRFTYGNMDTLRLDVQAWEDLVNDNL
ncbi:hypothetical protein [Xanthocytophaga flava]|uniref:hypothetical protein n=1 Tax=Xanthocytophaga flava TaxID=3048013 RepID=UPI0028D5C5D4|nr:hypothetical protein [Xanthocytophaga flavus]MDJ1470874.1 hypothetical protein [Xanthocytophaga flavus]